MCRVTRRVERFQAQAENVSPMISTILSEHGSTYSMLVFALSGLYYVLRMHHDLRIVEQPCTDAQDAVVLIYIDFMNHCMH